MPTVGGATGPPPDSCRNRSSAVGKLAPGLFRPGRRFVQARVRLVAAGGGSFPSVAGVRSCLTCDVRPRIATVAAIAALALPTTGLGAAVNVRAQFASKHPR